MNKLYLVKTLLVLLSGFSLMSCAHFIDNPYDNVPRSQLRQIGSTELCSVVRDQRYKININVNNEVTRRGFKDCSSSEVYCLSKLSLVPGTNNFAACRLLRDQYELNVQSQATAAYIGMRQIQLQQEALHTPVQVNMNHSGYINHYVY